MGWNHQLDKITSPMQFLIKCSMCLGKVQWCHVRSIQNCIMTRKDIRRISFRGSSHSYLFWALYRGYPCHSICSWIRDPPCELFKTSFTHWIQAVQGVESTISFGGNSHCWWPEGVQIGRCLKGFLGLQKIPRKTIYNQVVPEITLRLGWKGRVSWKRFFDVFAIFSPKLVRWVHSFCEGCKWSVSWVKRIIFDVTWVNEDQGWGSSWEVKTIQPCHPDPTIV